MEPGARSRLAAAMRRYLAAQPWTLAEDDYLFGLDDRTSGLLGCASVLGAAGMEFGLSVNLGEEGFSLLEKLIADEIDHSTLQARSSSILFSISDAAPASRAFKRLEPMVIEKKKIAAPRRGYLTSWWQAPGREPRPLESTHAVFLARCLEAVAGLAESGELGKAPRKEGSRTLLFELTEDEGKLRIHRCYREIQEVAVEHPRLQLSPELLAKLERSPRVDGRYLLSIFSPPATIKGEMMWLALMLDDAGFVIHAEPALSFGAAAASVFEAFGGKTTVKDAQVGVPRELWTDALSTLAALEDAAGALGVRLVSMAEIPELEQAKKSLRDHFGAG